jgi:hypothetical protein
MVSFLVGLLKLNINSTKKKKKKGRKQNYYDPLFKQALNTLFLVKYHGIVGKKKKN